VVEKRGHPRVHLGIPVSCRRKDGATFTGTARDISVAGMFVETDQQATFAEELTLAVKLPTSRNELSLPAIVRWTDDSGFGVQFGLIGARETHALSELFRK
jgi:type IV pilus assembly protein PilZ